METMIFTYFQYFYSAVSGHKSFVFRPTIAETKMASSLQAMIPSLTESKLFDYMCYQFYYWHDKDTKFGRGKIQFNWVVGKKAVERWNGRADWYSYRSSLTE